MREYPSGLWEEQSQGMDTLISVTSSYDVGAMSQPGQPGHTCNALTARANQGSRKCTEPAQRYDKDTRTYAIRELSHLR